MNLIQYRTPQRSNLTPSARFQSEVERFFDAPFFGAETHRPQNFGPVLDLYQDADTLTLKAELPGVKREDFNLTLHEGNLSISGERRLEKTEGEKGALRNERFFGKFERTIALPFQVDASRVTANYEDGILTVTLPKAEEAKARQIEIK